MKKKSLLILFLVLILTVPFVLTACYASKPGYLKDIVGTYELTSFTRGNTDEKDNEGNTVTHDLLKENGVVCYLVIRADGTGYQVYKDKDTEWRALELKISFVYDEEEPDKVREINYVSGITLGSSKAPDNAKETLGVYAKTFKKKLNFTMPAVFGNKTSQSVAYTRVNKATDLSYVSKKTGRTFSTVPFEVVGLDKAWIEDPNALYSENSDRIYYYINIDIVNKKADIYYALKLDDLIDQEQKGVTVDYTIPQNSTDDIILTIGQNTFRCSRNLSGGTPSVYVVGEDGMQYFWTVTAESNFNKEERAEFAKQYYNDYIRYNE